ncbi:hypothetical protein SAMN02910456_00522 [Ruminococcaceae bacterium YRB3002]|nr:hypothetical protein SAMN02910456_00522 [Ruminococcaceae bacterium YRB3002]
MERQMYRDYMDSVHAPEDLKDRIKNSHKAHVDNRLRLTFSIIAAAVVCILFGGVAAVAVERIILPRTTAETRDVLKEYDMECQYGKVIHYTPKAGDPEMLLMGSYDNHAENHHEHFTRFLTKEELKTGKFYLADEYLLDAEEYDVEVTVNGEDVEISVDGVILRASSEWCTTDKGKVTDFIGNDDDGTVYVVIFDTTDGDTSLTTYSWNNGETEIE